MVGQGLQHLLASPMAQDQQQFPDPTDIVKQIMQQFREYVRKRGTGASMGRPAIQAPVGTPPREKAGRMRSAGMEGVGTFMEQAGETAAEPWKPKALDIGLMAATIALPIIAAMQPEGRGRRGRRKQQRMSDLFKGLGKIAGGGLKYRTESFKTGKEATFGAAKARAELAGEEIGAKYKHEIGRIGAERKALTEDRAYRTTQDYLDIAQDREARLGLPEPVDYEKQFLQEIYRKIKAGESLTTAEYNMWLKEIGQTPGKPSTAKPKMPPDVLGGFEDEYTQRVKDYNIALGKRWDEPESIVPPKPTRRGVFEQTVSPRVPALRRKYPESFGPGAADSLRMGAGLEVKPYGPQVSDIRPYEILQNIPLNQWTTEELQAYRNR